MTAEWRVSDFGELASAELSVEPSTPLRLDPGQGRGVEASRGVPVPLLNLSRFCPVPFALAVAWVNLVCSDAAASCGGSVT